MQKIQIQIHNNTMHFNSASKEAMSDCWVSSYQLQTGISARIKPATIPYNTTAF